MKKYLLEKKYSLVDSWVLSLFAVAAYALGRHLSGL
jgi:hypothetical protein